MTYDPTRAAWLAAYRAARSADERVFGPDFDREIGQSIAVRYGLPVLVPHKVCGVMLAYHARAIVEAR